MPLEAVSTLTAGVAYSGEVMIWYVPLVSPAGMNRFAGVRAKAVLSLSMVILRPPGGDG